MVAQRILKELLDNSKVRMKDPLTVQTKIESMIIAGLYKLMVNFYFCKLSWTQLFFNSPKIFKVITDFDYTLSCHLRDGVRCSTTHGVFEKQINGINSEFHKKVCFFLFKKILIEFF